MNWFHDLTRTGLAIGLATVMAMPAAQAQDQQAQEQQAQEQQAQEQQAQDQQAQPQQAAGQAQAAPAAGQPVGGQATQDQQAQAQDQQAEEQKGEKERRKLKIFELEHRDPQQLTQLLNLWDKTANMQGRTAQARAALQRAQQQQGGEQDDKVAIAMDSEKKLLFVRGTEEQIEKIESLISAVDVQNDELEPYDFADHRLIPMPSAATAPVTSTLNQLGLAGHMIQLGDVTLIAYRVDEDEDDRLQQAEEVINKLAGREKAKQDQEEAGDQDANEQDAADQDAQEQDEENDQENDNSDES